MNYYDDIQNVEQYIKMAEGFDGRELIPILRMHLEDGATVLELGMGPGKDLALLGQHFQVTGSDYAAVFVKRYQAQHPTADVLVLDAVTMDIERQFDCIYSNKVLYHLTKAELQQSFERQAAVLKEGGLLFHTFWAGDAEEEMHGLTMVYHTAASLTELLGSRYEVIDIKPYAEMEDDDSLILIARKGVEQ
ncbi:MAG: class I SAM-dependent methyltransferase [Anaerolineales bacterium]|nr:class I SAM-dependent methyltransferase [Anaerolineales bacterium]